MLFVILIYFSNPKNLILPAQAADNILRPILGSKNTITLESWYFALNDNLTKLEYQYKKPEANIFTPAITHNSMQLNSSMNLKPLSFNNQLSPLPYEGIWQVIPETLFPKQTVMVKTFIRPDPTRTYAIVSLVKMNMKELGIGVQAGTYYPGGAKGIFGPGVVPKTIQKTNSLVAVFNGGFQEKDGHYGMIVGHKTYVPLRYGLATLVISSDGSANMINYQGQLFNKNVIGIRQNGVFLVKNGQVTPFTENGADTWGRTTTNSMYTWRSGIGITRNGNLIYAVGNALIPQTLAKALQKAGAINAMQLDINPYWVRYILYDPIGNGNYSYYPLLKDMYNGGYAYLHGYNKDFFYVYKKS